MKAVEVPHDSVICSGKTISQSECGCEMPLKVTQTGRQVKPASKHYQISSDFFFFSNQPRKTFRLLNKDSTASPS